MSSGSTAGSAHHGTFERPSLTIIAEKAKAGPFKPSDAKHGPQPDLKDDLKSLPLPEVEKKLGSSLDGLSQAEAAKRLAQYGPNELKEK